MVAQAPDTCSISTTTSQPNPQQDSAIPISPPELKPPEFIPLKQDQIQPLSSSSSSVNTPVFTAAPPPEEVVKPVTIKEEEDHEEATGFNTVEFDDFSDRTPSYYSSSSSAHSPKPMEGLHETGPPPFLKKTFEMVEDPETNSTVSWSKTGHSFIVWDAYDFSKHLLPKYFKHSNFSSFIRQLNTYGFRKIDPDKWEFANEGFRGGKKHLLKNIKRRSRHNKQQQGVANGYVDDSQKLVLESQIESLKNDQDQLRLEILKIRHEQEESENRISSFEQRIQSANNKQLQMLIFLAKAAKSRSFLQNLLGKIKQRKELNGRDFCKKRRLLYSQFPESSPDEKSGSHSQSVDCRNQAQQQLATMQTQLAEILGEDAEQGKTMAKLFETALSTELCSPNDEESVYHLMSETLLDDRLVPQNSVDEDLDVNDSKFYLELEDLIGKPRTWGGFATELAGCI